MRLALTLALLAAPVAAQTFTVAPSGGDFTQIQAAIDAAPPGATVLVAAGQYDPFVLSKPLTILGEGSGLVRVGDWLSSTNGGSAVEQLPAGASARISGFEFRVAQCSALSQALGLCVGAEGAPLRVVASSGVVVLHDVVVDWSDVWDSAFFGDALRVTDASLVIVDRARLGTFKILKDTAAIRAVRSTLWIGDSVLQGGSGTGNFPWPAGAGFGGTEAVHLEDSVLYAARSSFYGGGPGAYEDLFGQVHTIPGGSGIVAEASALKLVGGPASVIDGAVDLIVEDGSFALVGAGWSGPETVIADASSLVDLAAAHYPTLRFVARSVAPGGATTLQIAGAPGSLVRTFGSFDVSAPFALAGVDGAVAISLGALVVLPPVALGPQGDASVPIAVPSGIGDLLLHVQALAMSPSGELALSNPASLAILQ
ncbi:MAG TPA: hypothetical protein VJP77_01750 [Planctomycetota bacterium]|nr:hypothetical protein [Planctomycetota bacterium]